MDLTVGRAGRVREYAKLAVRDALHKRNLDLVKNPFPVRIATALSWLEVDTVLDVGANIGQYATGLRASGYRGRIISCEPLSDAYRHLERRSKGDGSWTVLNTAVGAEPGSIEINISANSYSSSVLPMADAHRDAAPGSEFIGSETVPLTTVADLVTKHGVDPAKTLLKIDTQGYESAVLDGAAPVLDRFAAAQLELSMVPLYDGQALFDEMVERMGKAGFGVFVLEGGFSDPRTGRMLQADGFFVRSDLMARPVD